MRALSLFISIPITLFCVLFAVANTGTVDLFAFPGSPPVTVPVYLAGLVLLAAGFLSGAFFVWLNDQKKTFRYWQEKKRADRLEKELNDLTAQKNAAEAEKLSLPGR